MDQGEWIAAMNGPLTGDARPKAPVALHVRDDSAQTVTSDASAEFDKTSEATITASAGGDGAGDVGKMGQEKEEKAAKPKFGAMFQRKKTTAKVMHPI